MNNYSDIPEFQRTINNIATIVIHNSDKGLRANYNYINNISFIDIMNAGGRLSIT